MDKATKFAATAAALAALIAAIALMQPVITGLAVDNTSHQVIVQVFVLGNRAPVLDAIGNLTATEGIRFTKTITASDADKNDLTFSENATFFSINATSGVINFTPAFADIGNHSVRFNVTDGNLSDTELVNFEVRRGLFCGDGVCSGDETCLSCSTDCGSCPAGGGGTGSGTGTGTGSGTGSGTGTGAGGGGGGGFGGFLGFCDEQWECTEWSACAEELQTRTCTDSNKCRTFFSKPEEERACFAEEEITAAPDHCSDGVKNAGEEDVDCGGECGPCVVRRFARIPVPDIPFTEITKQFPWIIPMVMSILTAAMAAADRGYTFYVRKLEFSRFRKKEAAYRKWRRRLYTGIISMGVLALFYSIYIYHYSLSYRSMVANMWMPAAASFVVPVGVYFALRKQEYSEFHHRVARERLKRVHERQLWELAKLENETLLKLEEKVVNNLGKIIDTPGYSNLAGMKELARNLFDLHTGQTSATILDDGTKKLLAEAAGQVPNVYNNYPELARLGEDLKKLAGIAEGDEGHLIEAAGNLQDSVREVARDRLLLSIITSDKTLTSHYNRVVDVYRHFEGIEGRRKENDKAIADAESQFIQLFDQNLGSDFIESHKDDSSFVRAYNSIVGLYDHFKNR